MKIQNTEPYELANLAYGLLKPHRDPKRALNAFRETLAKRPELLTALLMNYLSARAAEMTGASQPKAESHLACDRPGKTPRTSQCLDESPKLSDRPVSRKSGASHQGIESRPAFDRPAAPAKSKITAKGLSVVQDGIWRQKIGIDGVDLEKATRHHFVTIRRKTIALGGIADMFLTEVDWPDDETPLSRVASADQVKAIWGRRHKILDAAGLTNVPV